MRYLILGLLLSACSHKPIRSNSFDLKTVRLFQVGKSTREDAFRILGKPASTYSKPNIIAFEYLDVDGLPRLTLRFNELTGTLFDAIWLPKESNPESKLELVKAEFRDYHFEEHPEKINHPHFIFVRDVNYVAEFDGMSIRYNLARKSVEAIAFYEKKPREPASK